ncbi:MAG: hypothetical protein AB7K09_13150 [Planctomycetota bacterium]
MLVLFVAVGVLVVGCASTSPVAKDTSTMTAVPIGEATAETFQAAGDASGSGGLIFVPAGTDLPLEVSLDLGAMQGEFGASRLRFTRDVYLLLRGGLWLSPDRERWASIDNPAALRSLFGLGAGQFNFGLGINKESGTHASIRVAMQPAAQ